MSAPTKAQSLRATLSGAESKNELYYGDNLSILRDHILSESIDLIYLDPPFNSNQDYNVLFTEQDGSRAAAQMLAFEDTWQWDQVAAQTYQEVVENGGKASQLLRAFWTFLGGSNMMAYLVMMTPRLIELHRVLKPTGSIYLHCDPTASHYLRMIMDAIFDAGSYRNEIIWKRSSAHSDTKQGARHYGRVTDTILFYAKGDGNTWNQEYAPYDEGYVNRDYRRLDEHGRRYRLDNIQGPGGGAKGNPYYEVMGVTRYWRYSKEKMQELIAQGRIIQTRPGAVPQYKRYLDEMKGMPIQNLWSDIPVINNRSKEKLGYPTQKPEALLERIIQASSNEGDTVLDPFCGCGTTIDAAQRLNRRWVGIDITHLAIGLIKHRLQTAYNGSATYEVIGEPVSIYDAEALAKQSPYQFQWWAAGSVGGRIDKKKGADQGIDGRLFFHDDPKPGNTKQIILSVKSGHIPANHIRELRGVIERENVAMGVLLTLQKPTRPMRSEAASAGFYHSPWGTKHPRLQIITIEELLEGKGIDYPKSQANVTYKRAVRKAKGEKPQPQRLPYTN